MKSLIDRIKGDVTLSFLIAFIVAAGIVARIAQYLFNRSFWLDEAYLAVSFISGGFSDIWHLKYDQIAPIAFLFITKFLVLIFGCSEYVFRFFPLVCGCAALLLFIPLSRTLLDKTSSIIALVLFSFSSAAIYYSSEFKQYSLDVLFSVGILLSSITIIRNLDKTKNLILLGFLGIISIWFAHSSVFVLGGVFLVMMFTAFRRHRESGWFIFGIVCMIVTLSAVSFMINYLLFLKTTAHNIGLYAGWKPEFAPFPLKTLNDLQWYPTKILEIINNVISLKFPGLVIISFVAGLFNFFRTRRFGESAILLSPIVLLFIVSAIQFYPITPRLILFLIPVFYIIIAEGAVVLYRILYRYHYCIGIAFLVLLLAYPSTTVASRIAKPYYRQEVKPCVDYLVKHLRKNDDVYLYCYSVPGFQFYTRNYQIEHIKGLSPLHEMIFSNIKGDRLKNLYLSDIDRLKGKSQVWFMFSHVQSEPLGINEESLYMLYLDQQGKRLDEFHRPGASLYLYDLTGFSLSSQKSFYLTKNSVR
jgi:hypothetical protein